MLAKKKVSCWCLKPNISRRQMLARACYVSDGCIFFCYKTSCYLEKFHIFNESLFNVATYFVPIRAFPSKRWCITWWSRRSTSAVQPLRRWWGNLDGEDLQLFDAYFAVFLGVRTGAAGLYQWGRLSLKGRKCRSVGFAWGSSWWWRRWLTASGSELCPAVGQGKLLYLV